MSRTLLVVLAAALFLLPAAAHASASGLVVSQVYGGGGNAGATFQNDYIELFNRGSSAASLAGWSVQYASSGGTGAWTVTPLNALTLQPGQYYLVQEAQGDGPVRNRRGNVVAADAALGHGRAWAVLPRPTRIERQCRCAAADGRRHRHDQSRGDERKDRARACRDRADLRCVSRNMLRRSARRGSRRLRKCERLRGKRLGSRPVKHVRGRAHE